MLPFICTRNTYTEPRTLPTLQRRRRKLAVFLVQCLALLARKTDTCKTLNMTKCVVVHLRKYSLHNLIIAFLSLNFEQISIRYGNVRGEKLDRVFLPSEITFLFTQSIQFHYFLIWSFYCWCSDSNLKSEVLQWHSRERSFYYFASRQKITGLSTFGELTEYRLGYRKCYRSCWLT